jgi:hypothetical protein
VDTNESWLYKTFFFSEKKNHINYLERSCCLGCLIRISHQSWRLSSTGDLRRSSNEHSIFEMVPEYRELDLKKKKKKKKGRSQE